LIGVVVEGVPQLGLERDLIKEYFDHKTGSGFAYAYQYPGFNRVQQAPGRGIIVLIDDRFTHARYRQLFPSHWRGHQVVQNTREMKDKLTRFWSRA
jgi:DNA excision repair protein ERCC-2